MYHKYIKLNEKKTFIVYFVFTLYILSNVYVCFIYYHSYDKIICDDDNEINNYPVDFLPTSKKEGVLCSICTYIYIFNVC